MNLEAGDKAPDFRLVDDRGAEVALENFKGNKVVIYFYPRAFTPGCTTESCDFRDRHEFFSAAGYDIVGISPDPVDKLARFRDEHELPFPLLSDPDHEVAGAYGAWGVKKNYGREYEGIVRSTVIIDESGSVEQAWYNVRAKGHVARVADSVLAE